MPVCRVGDDLGDYRGSMVGDGSAAGAGDPVVPTDGSHAVAHR
jgi:hypothetical protein